MYLYKMVTVEQLKKMLQLKGLPTSGVKHVLFQHLWAQQNEEEEQEAERLTDEEDGEEEDGEETEEEYKQYKEYE